MPHTPPHVRCGAHPASEWGMHIIYLPPHVVRIRPVSGACMRAILTHVRPISANDSSRAPWSILDVAKTCKNSDLYTHTFLSFAFHAMNLYAPPDRFCELPHTILEKASRLSSGSAWQHALIRPWKGHWTPI